MPFFSIISAKVAPFLRWSMATTCAVLLPSRGAVASCALAARLPLGAFLEEMAFLSCLALRGRALGRLWATFGLTCGFRLQGLCRVRFYWLSQVLDTLPDSGSGRRPILELLERGNGWQAVPDGHQALPRPCGDQFCQFLLAGEGIKRGGGGGGRLFRGAMRRDVIVCVYGESRHNRFLSAALNAVMT